MGKWAHWNMAESGDLTWWERPGREVTQLAREDVTSAEESKSTGKLHIEQAKLSRPPTPQRYRRLAEDRRLPMAPISRVVPGTRRLTNI